MNNYHTHTTFCDGKNTAEEMVLSAIESGCNQIGFSGHSYTDFDTSYCMSREKTEEYKKTILSLKEKYKDKITICLGIEQDYFSCEPTHDYDYIIGSVHYILKDGNYLSVDESAARQIDDVNKYYNGDFYAYIEDYYSQVGKVYERTKCDIIGHFDLVTKFNEDGKLFDTGNERYKNAYKKALEKLLSSPAKFEINTGAISRGHRKTPYPSDEIMNIIAKNEKPFVLSSDSHSKNTILFGLEEIKEKLDKNNYKYCKNLNEIKAK